MICKRIIRDLQNSDLPEVTRIHLAAFQGRALTQLGAGAVHRYYLWQFDGPHDIVALGAFENKDLCGFCFAGFFRGALSGFLEKNRKYLIQRILIRPVLVLNPLIRDRIWTSLSILKRRQAKSITPLSTPALSFGILSIAIDPSKQGIGCGTMLMSAVENAAVDRGFQRMNLTVDVDNINAIRFYEGLNWEKNFSLDGIWRGSMVKTLDIKK